MKLLEYEGKKIFTENGIPVPKAYFFREEREGLGYLQELGGRGILKTQVLAGGRGKAGGVRTVNWNNFRETFRSLQQLKINGEEPHGFLLEEVLNIKKELYLGFIIDTTRGLPLFLGSAAGGVDVEEIFRSTAAGACQKHLDPTEGFYHYHALNLAVQMGLNGAELVKVAQVIERLYKVFYAYDCEMAEINPLVITQEGGVLAADAKVVINDDALFRQQRLFNIIVQDLQRGSDLEQEARQNNIQFVDLSGDVAVLSIGAGLTMTAMDLIAHAGGKPANFIDAKGGVTKEIVAKMTELVLKKINREPQIKCLVVTIALSATQLSSLVLGIAETIAARGCRVPVLSVVHATDAALQEMDLETARKEFERLEIKIFPQLKEMFAYCRDLLKEKTI